MDIFPPLLSLFLRVPLVFRFLLGRGKIFVLDLDTERNEKMSQSTWKRERDQSCELTCLIDKTRCL